MGSKLTSGAEAISQELFASSSVQQMSLGALVHSDDGRSFRYVKMGAVAAVPGKLQQAPAVVPNHQNVTCAVAAVGATSLTVTLGGTAATKDQYAGGLVAINDVTGEGHTYLVKSHPAADASATLALELSDPIVVATSATSQASLLPNCYGAVIVNPTTPTNKPVGVAIYPIPASEFGFIQTRGLVSCLNDAGTTVGLAVAPSQATAGAVKTGATTLDSVGSAAQTATSTEYNFIDLRLD